MKKESFSICEAPRVIPQRGYLIGDFAISGKTNHWRITHIATGFSCNAGMKTRKIALGLVQKLAKIPGTNKGHLGEVHSVPRKTYKAMGLVIQNFREAEG